MKNKLLLLSTLALAGLSTQAQELKDGYITYPQSTQLASYIQNWVPGTQIFEDEAFFISRVQPKPYFRNQATQVDPTYNDDNDKRLVFWVPMGSASVNGIMQNAMPNGDWNTEMFSMWSYVPHFGNFTMPYGWAIGAMADVAHKNGTAVSGNASVPWGAISSGWNDALMAMTELDKEKVAKFLLYHGVDGLDYNSEFNSDPALVAGLRDLHAYLYHYMAEEVNGKVRNAIWENIWYDGTNDEGRIQFDSGLDNHNALNFGDAENPRSSFFFNYNWNRGYLERSAEYAAGLGRNSNFLYAGVNMQGGEPATNNWVYLKNQPISVGLWGAHDTNMIWAARNGNGSDPEVVQAYYQKLIEQFFTNGNRNPINAIEIQDTPRLYPSDDFFGMSAFMSARSTLCWDLAAEPFITNFNVGNGKFFNWKGEAAGTSAWANIGMQDYLPTWRWWWSTEFLGNSKENVPANQMTAGFKWDEAYLGGSSLAIQGTTKEPQYLHLFKTRFGMKSNDVITVRYKHLDGTADITLALSVDGAESREIENKNFTLLESTTQADPDGWVTKTIKISGALNSKFNNKNLAMVALKVENAENLDLRLGEFSIVRNSAPTPAKPSILSSKVLYNGITGIDAKVFFNMASNKTAEEPTYNIEVNTSFFKLYAQVEGQEPTLVSATTSWGAILYRIPCDPANVNNRVRVGVSAVSLDLESESEIAWSDYMNAMTYDYNNDVELNKSSIKPGESFAVRYVDLNHPVGNFEIQKDGKTLLSGTAGMGNEWTIDGISEIGQYDLIENVNGNVRQFPCFIQITPEAIGAQPEIYTLTANGSKVEGAEINLGNPAQLGYTGRDADGVASRAIAINEKFVGIPVADLGIESQHSFSLSAWVKFNYSGGSGSRFLSIENRMASWPYNNWGWIWSGFDANGNIENYTFRTSITNGSREIKYFFDNARIVPNAWTHIACVFEYNGEGGFKSTFYINGTPQQIDRIENGDETITGEIPFIPNDFPVDPATWICIGGGAGPAPVYNTGFVDDVTVWNKVLTADEVKECMDGLDTSKQYNDLLGYWSFENDPQPAASEPNTGDFFYPVLGSKSEARCGNFDILPTGAEGQSQQTYVTPILDAGSPFIPGSAFKVETKPTWSVRNATLSDAQGNGEKGSVNVTFKKEGDFNVTLTLANSLGSDTRSYPVIKASNDPGSVETVGVSGGVEAYTTDAGVIVAFDEAGEYTVNVYNTAGMTLAQRSARVEAGQTMTVSLGANGVYLVNVLRDGKIVRNVKVLKK